jgi:hypothetical protein
MTTTDYPIVHGTPYGYERCREHADTACIPCVDAHRDGQRSRSIRRGRQRATGVSLEALAAILASPVGVVLVSELGPLVCSRITPAADEHGSPEYRRLRAVGVNPQSAALLAQYRREAG